MNESVIFIFLDSLAGGKIAESRLFLTGVSPSKF